ncbi:MAG: glycosyltransferase family 39 protein [Candidatus Promineofilum sp.]|nr:glycosyltransferase family 39 protein [Promineifilum sp.]
MAGVLALGLVALDPNILAHTRLVTTDLGLAAGAALAGYTLWRFLRRPSWSAALLAGAGLGLLQNTKFTAALFVPLFALVVVVALWARRRTIDRRLLAQLLIIFPAMALLTLWATNGFQVGPLNAPLPLLGDLGGRAVPLSHYLDQLLDIGGRLQVGTPAFLLGRYSDSGWWWYFPVAFLVKTPLPVLLLLLFALLRIVMGSIDSRTQHNYLTSSDDHHSPFPSPPGRGTGRGSSALPSPNPSQGGRHPPRAPPGEGQGEGLRCYPPLTPPRGRGTRHSTPPTWPHC